MAGLLDLIQPSPDGGMGLLGSVLSRIDAMKRRAGGLLSPGGADQLMSSIAEDARSNMNLAGQGFDTAQSVMPGVASQGIGQIAQAGMPAAMGLMTVYHGSPYAFDKFDMSKVGTGEGAQAYGHGLYFADRPGVAQSYAANVAVARDKRAALNSGINRIALDHRSTATADDVREYLRATPEVSEFANNSDLIRNMLTAIRGQHSDGTVTDAALRAYKQIEAAVPEVQPNLYKVDIPDEAIGRMLQWDKPLSEQPQAVQEALKEVPPGMYIDPKTWTTRWLTEPQTGADLYQMIERKVAQEYPGATKGAMPPQGFNAQALATEKLRALGIPGIRYLDQGSRGAGEGTYNTVLFDPELAKILGRE